MLTGNNGTQKREWENMNQKQKGEWLKGIEKLAQKSGNPRKFFKKADLLKFPYQNNWNPEAVSISISNQGDNERTAKLKTTGEYSRNVDRNNERAPLELKKAEGNSEMHSLLLRTAKDIDNEMNRRLNMKKDILTRRKADQQKRKWLKTMAETKVVNLTHEISDIDQYY